MQVMGRYWMKWVEPQLCRLLSCPVCWVILPWWCSAAGSTVDAMLQSTHIDYHFRNDSLPFQKWFIAPVSLFQEQVKSKTKFNCSGMLRSHYSHSCPQYNTVNLDYSFIQLFFGWLCELLFIPGIILIPSTAYYSGNYRRTIGSGLFPRALK